ncbi:MCE family protein [Nocardioides marmoribigeumensis]|uniref:Phospholipid/cholesterol/gamma-HCH transport system substrate-binding protein n=1 Tax=Nocardioides marmoribigeumensis TaxID=433649 RepID=A0ABU2BVB4_9ACTN|nr:MCE family protein [Nocardioides marmoribigeumensis]MDR7362565.1 phospholipid/cholesterol/gamma-HCH transport system substrate-binding protein [Nocardioides marmoribigeumensis]
MSSHKTPKRAGRVAWTERDPAVIAVVGLVLIALLLLVAGSWQRLPFVDRSTSYRAEFTDAAGLVTGEEVRVAGVKVGTVRDIELAGDKVVVGFTVTGVRLGTRTEAGIEVKTLLGQHFLSVTPAGQGSLREDALIPVARTSTPVNIVPAFNRLADETAHTDTAQVAAAFDSLATTLRRTAPDMEGALTGLSRLSTSVTKRDRQIASLFDKAESVTGVVAARDKELGELLTASDQVLSVLERRKETIREVISGTRALAVQLRGLVRDNRAALGPALEDLDTVVRVLRRNEDDIERSLTYLAPYAREFTNVGGSGEWFDSSLKFPKNLSLCSTGDSTDPTGGLLDPVLSALNQQVNGSSQPCLPLGPATGSRRQGGS